MNQNQGAVIATTEVNRHPGERVHAHRGERGNVGHHTIATA